MATFRFSLLTLPLAAASIALGACGTGGSVDASAGTGSRQAQFREAGLKFAKCMREHGVDMPDPKVGEGGKITLGAGPGITPPNSAALERAQKACQKILDSVRPPEMSKEQEQKFKDQALKFAQCMREQGINMPDPKFGAGGRMTQRMEGGPGQNDSRIKAAMDKCSKFQPAVGRSQAAK